MLSNVRGYNRFLIFIYPEIDVEQYMKLHIRIDDLLDIFFHISANITGVTSSFFELSNTTFPPLGVSYTFISPATTEATEIRIRAIYWR